MTVVHALREWCSIVNTVILTVGIVVLLARSQRSSDNKVRIAKGSEDRAKVALAAILGVCDDIKAQLGDSGFHPTVRDEIPE